MSAGRFVWFELVTKDVEGGIAFWTKVAGLLRKDMDMGSFAYPMLHQGETAFAGVVPPQMDGVPPNWLSYWSVDDVDARTAKVEDAGGKVIVPPTDIPTVGRFSLIADPQGAVVALFKGLNESEPATRPMSWVELWSKDVDAVLPFYTSLLDLEVDQMTMPAGPYHVFKAGGVQVGGAMTSPNPDAPPMWLPYLAVGDLDATLTAVREAEGALLVDPMSVEGVGRFAVVADRQGAALGLLQP
ncbi:MAG: VOC family protein [Alphaproteobacteria bacterium]|nr:VOC family protein [Alphaproteobacteria bacterium]MCB9697700.1 VOC family protein [Alphaproteobacteria bacterium]